MLEKLPEYCTLLVTGPPGVGKFGWFLDIATQALNKGEKVIFITVEAHPSMVRDSLLHFGVEPDLVNEDNICFVDCYSNTLEKNSDSKPMKGVYPVRSLSNVEEINLAISKATNKLGRPVRILFYTVSSLFLYNSMQSIARFYQMLSSRVKTDYGFAAFAMQHGVHEDSTVALFSSFVDGVIQMRFDDDLNREWRLHHIKGAMTSPKWESFGVSKYGFILNLHEKRITSCFLDYECPVKSKREAGSQ